MENKIKKKKKPKHILKKKQKRTIDLNQRYKKEQKSTKRERKYSQFCGGKNMD